MDWSDLFTPLGGGASGIVGTLAFQWFQARRAEADARRAEADSDRVRAEHMPTTPSTGLAPAVLEELISLRAEVGALKEALAKADGRVAGLRGLSSRVEKLEGQVLDFFRDNAADQRDLGTLIAHVEGLQRTLEGIQAQCRTVLGNNSHGGNRP